MGFSGLLLSKLLLNKGRLLTIGGAVVLAGLIIWIKVLGVRIESARAERDVARLRYANALHNLEAARTAIDVQNAAIDTLHQQGQLAQAQARTALANAGREADKTKELRTELVRESQLPATRETPLTARQLTAWKALQ